MKWDLAVSGPVAGRWPHRVFLDAREREAFKTWDVPVRYAKQGWRAKLGDKCKVCDDSARQVAHKIPYKDGILKHGLTPSYLWRWENLVATCKTHNRTVQWGETRIKVHVAKLHRREPRAR